MEALIWVAFVLVYVIAQVAAMLLNRGGARWFLGVPIPIMSILVTMTVLGDLARGEPYWVLLLILASVVSLAYIGIVAAIVALVRRFRRARTT